MTATTDSTLCLQTKLNVSVAPGYTIAWHPPVSGSVAYALNSTRWQSRLSPDISDRMHLLFTQVHFLFDSSAGSEVNMLQINERTHFFIKISLTLYSQKCDVVVCERLSGDEERLLYWPSSTSFSSWLGCSTLGYWGLKALCLPLALKSAICFQLTRTVCALVI